MSKYIRSSFYIGLIVIFNSCINSRESVYFNNLSSGSLAGVQTYKEASLQKNDILSINISSLNPEASEIFNVQNEVRVTTSTPTGSNAQVSGYLINEDGFIQLPIIGNVKAEGLTKKQLTNHITQLLVEKKLLVDPIVNIRHLNYKVTVLGEVGRPTVISVPNEKITLLEAIGLAGDITIFGKKENVLLIREKPTGQKEITRINLNTDQVFQSDFYYLQPNDVVYVEPNKAKIASASNTRLWLPSVFSGLSLVANVIWIINR